MSALLLCLLGPLAFLATRSMAHDARHVLPVVVEPMSYEPADAPRLSRCDSNEGAHYETATVDRYGFRIGGSSLGAPGSLGVRSEAEAKLKMNLEMHAHLF